MSSHLFSPLVLRSVEFHNRIFVSPMCQYSSENGMPNEWHFVHLGSRAIGGASMVCVEASGVTPEGRITPWDAGIWSQAHAQAWAPIARFLREHGAVPAIQIAHAGRKASVDKPWKGGKPLALNEGGWHTLAPSDIAFGHYAPPRAMTRGQIKRTVDDFARDRERGKRHKQNSNRRDPPATCDHGRRTIIPQPFSANGDSPA
jgi:2,4-dienoyl-CoA reductase-like NADH-dependent reductase (Old Yellow Enzyme family)